MYAIRHAFPCTLSASEFASGSLLCGIDPGILVDAPNLAAVAGDLEGGPPDEAQLTEDVPLSQAILAARDVASATADIAALLSLQPRPRPLTLYDTIMEGERASQGPDEYPGNFSEVLAQADTTRIADGLKAATAHLGDGIRPASGPQVGDPVRTRPVTVVGLAGVAFSGFSTVDQLGDDKMPSVDPKRSRVGSSPLLLDPGDVGLHTDDEPEQAVRADTVADLVAGMVDAVISKEKGADGGGRRAAAGLKRGRESSLSTMTLRKSPALNDAAALAYNLLFPGCASDDDDDDDDDDDVVITAVVSWKKVAHDIYVMVDQSNTHT